MKVIKEDRNRSGPHIPPTGVKDSAYLELKLGISFFSPGETPGLSELGQ